MPALPPSRLPLARRPTRGAAVLAALLAGGALASTPARAWTPATQTVIAREAVQLAPFDLARQLDRHADQWRAGVLAPFQGTAPEDHYKNPDGSGNLDRVILAEVEGAIQSLRAMAPLRDVVYRLGVVAHYVADANNPLNSSAADPREIDYFADYLRYAQSAEPRFTLVFYAGGPGLESEGDVRQLVQRALSRGRSVYPLVGAEYQRIGYASGVGRFDDRSTAFGVAAVSFSHAVSDVARVLRYVWLRGGGGDHRQLLWSDVRRLVLLPRSGR